MMTDFEGPTEVAVSQPRHALVRTYSEREERGSIMSYHKLSDFGRRSHPISASPACGGSDGHFRSARPLGSDIFPPEWNSSPRPLGTDPFDVAVSHSASAGFGNSGPRRGAASLLDQILLQREHLANLNKAIGLSCVLLGPETRARIEAILEPKSLAFMIALAIVWGGLHLVGIGELGDLGLAGLGMYTLITEAAAIKNDLVAFVRIAWNASCDEDFVSAAIHFDRAVAAIGVDTLLALLVHRATRVIRGTGTTTAPEPLSERYSRFKLDAAARDAKAIQEYRVLIKEEGAARQAFGEGRRRGRSASFEELFREELDAGTLDAINAFQFGNYAREATTIASALRGRNQEEIMNYMVERFGQPKKASGCLGQMFVSPRTPLVELENRPEVIQHVWELQDGTTVRLKERVQGSGNVDPFRSGPTYSISVRKLNRRGNALPDTYKNEAFKIDSSGNPVPKGPADLPLNLAQGLSDAQKRGFFKAILDRGHVQAGR